MQKNALLRLTFAVGLAGLGVFMGCSSSTTSSSSGTTTGAGGGGTTTTTTTTTGTGTGTGTTTGTTSTGQGGNGQGGNAQGGNGQGGGAPQCTGLYDSGLPECNTCLEGGCCQELVDCDNDPNCQPCFTGGEGCTQSGDAFDNLVACLSNGCSTECTPPTPEGCNPVSGEPCDGAAGQACDFGDTTTGFACYDPPNDKKLCEACDPNNGEFCANGMSCDVSGKCAKFCCSDDDCGAGNVCDILADEGYTVGFCHVKAGGGQGGGGGAGGAAPAGEPACDVPAVPPSGGSCVVAQ